MHMDKALYKLRHRKVNNLKKQQFNSLNQNAKPIKQSSLLELEQDIMLIQELNHQHHQNLKELLRQKMALQRQLYNSIGHHWTHFLRIMSETDPLDGEANDNRKGQPVKKEILRKLQIVANRIVSMRINSSLRLNELTFKAISIQKSIRLQRAVSRPTNILVEQSVVQG